MDESESSEGGTEMALDRQLKELKRFWYLARTWEKLWKEKVEKNRVLSSKQDLKNSLLHSTLKGGHTCNCLCVHVLFVSKITHEPGF